MNKPKSFQKPAQQNPGGSTLIHHEQRVEVRIPHNSPESLKKYAEIDEKFPDRILQGFEAESNHRRALEMKRERNDFLLNIVRLILAFLGGLVVLGVGCYFMLNGNPTQGASIICTVVVSFAGIFLGRSLFSKEKQHP